MTYINELLKLPVFWRNIIRKLENLKFKLLKAKWSSIFNEICLKEKLLPNYTRILILINEISNKSISKINSDNSLIKNIPFISRMISLVQTHHIFIISIFY